MYRLPRNRVNELQRDGNLQKSALAFGRLVLACLFVTWNFAKNMSNFTLPPSEDESFFWKQLEEVGPWYLGRHVHEN